MTAPKANRGEGMGSGQGQGDGTRLFYWASKMGFFLNQIGQHDKPRRHATQHFSIFLAELIIEVCPQQFVIPLHSHWVSSSGRM